MVGLLIDKDRNFNVTDDETELDYFIGIPFLGQGLISEAIKVLMKHAYENLDIQNLWYGYFADDEKSFKTQAKCDLQFHCTEENKLIPSLGDKHISYLSKEDWQALTSASLPYETNEP